MKKICTLLLTLATLYTYAQEFSTINFICRGSIGNTYAIYLNQHLLGTIKGTETLVYKIYSEGNLPVVVIWNGNKKTENAIDVRHGNTYYFESYGTDEKAVGVRKGKGLLKENKTIINGEESKDNPITVAPLAADNDLSKEGTCFLVSRKGYIVTNYHLVKDAKTVQVKGIGGDFTTLYGVDVVSYDADLDMALLKIKNPNISFDSIPYKLSSETNTAGTKSFVLGYPLTKETGQDIKTTEGAITAKNGYKGSISQYSFSKTIEPGASGSPLFNNQGDVIGMINTKLGLADVIGYAVKSQYIKTFLESLDTITPDMISSTGNLSMEEKVNKLKKYIFIVKAE